MDGSLLVVRVKFESGSVSSVFFFSFVSFLSCSKALIVILAFIMMCQLIFEALNMNEIFVNAITIIHCSVAN